MNTTFYILLSIKTPEGLENFGRFYIGNDRERAYELFGTLKGKDDIGDSDLLYLELMETVDNLPVNLKMKSCVLAEVGENCSLITREVFKSQIQPGQ
jgi:hypothetical protein